MSLSEPPIIRRPKAAYKGRNGFIEDQPIATSAISAPSAPAQRIRDETQKRRLAEWVLRERGSYFPTREELSLINAESETTSTVQTRIADLKERHTEDVNNLHAYYTQIRVAERADFRASVDDLPIEELEVPLNSSTSAVGYDLECNDALSRVRHAHLATLLPLQKQLSVLNTRFPETLEDYNAMDNNHDMQLKVARFLTAPPNRQDAIMSEYGWAYRQVQPLQNIFKADEDFRNEVQQFTKENESRDPRKRTM